MQSLALLTSSQMSCQVRPFINLRLFGGFLILTGFEQNAKSYFAEQVYSLFLCMQIYLHVLIFIVVF